MISWVRAMGQRPMFCPPMPRTAPGGRKCVTASAAVMTFPAIWDLVSDTVDTARNPRCRILPAVCPGANCDVKQNDAVGAHPKIAHDGRSLGPANGYLERTEMTGRR